MMSAGREMDALVAERVMGLTVVATDWPCGYDPECGTYEASSFLPASGSWYEDRGPIVAVRPDGWPPRELGRHDPPSEIEPTHGAMVEPVPFYSTDLLAAWTVVERFERVVIDKGWVGGRWVVYLATLHGRSGESTGEADLPVAICRAALLAATAPTSPACGAG